MAKAFVVAMRKGGSGKTTVSINLAAALARLGLRVALIDLDGQANATYSVGLRAEPGSTNVFQADAEWNDWLRPVPVRFHGAGDLALLPANDAIRQIEADRGTAAMIVDRIGELKQHMDAIILDTGPGLNEIHVGCYLAADYAILPCRLEMLSMHGVADTLRHLRSVEAAFDGAAQALFVQPTMYTPREKVQAANLSWLAGHVYGVSGLNTPIRDLTIWRKASSELCSIYTYPAEDGIEARSQRVAVSEFQMVLDAVLPTLDIVVQEAAAS